MSQIAVLPRLADRVPSASWSAAQRVAFWVGAWFVVNGIGAFVFYPYFTDGVGGGNVDGWSPLTIRVNGWHALFHLIPGLVGLVVAPHADRARRWVVSVGGLYFVAGIWGLIAGSQALMVISVERFGSWVHLVEGSVVALGLATSRRSRWPVVLLIVAFLAAAIVTGAHEHVLSACCCSNC